jgi:phosphoglycerate kinase
VKAAGFLMEAELKAFAAVIASPQRPLLAILGGAKIADKIPLIRNLIDKADEIIIGGGMAYTFKKVLNGMEIGESLFDPEGAKIVAELVEKAKAAASRSSFPSTTSARTSLTPTPPRGRPTTRPASRRAGWASTPAPSRSPSTARPSCAPRRSSGTGPPASSSLRSSPASTRAMAEAIAEATAHGATTVVGGGDTATAARKFKVADKVTHCSTGGGASLEYLEGKVLPGVAFLET